MVSVSVRPVRAELGEALEAVWHGDVAGVARCNDVLERKKGRDHWRWTPHGKSAAGYCASQTECSKKYLLFRSISCILPSPGYGADTMRYVEIVVVLFGALHLLTNFAHAVSCVNGVCS